MLRLLRPALGDAPSSLRLLSTSTAASEYLVSTWGLTPAQAVEASEYLECRSNADAIRAFLMDGLRLSKTAAACAVVRPPKLLRSSVDRILAPRVAKLRAIGVKRRVASDTEWDLYNHQRPDVIGGLVAACHTLLISHPHYLRLKIFLGIFGVSLRMLLTVLREHPGILDHSYWDVVRTNVRRIKEFDKPTRANDRRLDSFHKTFILAPRLFTSTPDELEAIVRRAKELAENSSTLRLAHVSGHPLCRQDFTAKVEMLRSRGLSTRQVASMVDFLPPSFLVSRPEKMPRRTVDFITREAGWEVDAIERCWSVFQRSIDHRLVPWFNVFSVLRAEGLLEKAIARRFRNGIDEWWWFERLTEQKFEEVFVRPYEQTIPAITDAYAPVRARNSRLASSREQRLQRKWRKLLPALYA